MPPDTTAESTSGSGSQSSPNGAAVRGFDSLVKSFFTRPSQDMNVDEEVVDLPSRPQSRMGFRDRGRYSPQHQGPSKEDETTIDETTEERSFIEGRLIACSESDSSDEWSDESEDSEILYRTGPPPPIICPLSYTAHNTNEARSLPVAGGYSQLYSMIPEVEPILEPIEQTRSSIPHHGLSQSALQHTRWMWGARYEQWMRWHLDIEKAAADANAYDGIVDTSGIEPPSSMKSRPTSPSEFSEQMPQTTEVNPAIFPRAGDLSTLHDPQAASLDHLFHQFPLWTIKKVLYVFNMDFRGSRKPPGPGSYDAGSDAPEADSQNESPATSEMDLTLVEEPSNKCLEDMPKGRLENAWTDLVRESASCAKDSETLRSPNWEHSWQARWEVLAELIRMNRETTICTIPLEGDVEHPASRSVSEKTSEAPASQQASGTRKFFFATDATPEDQENQDDEDSDDDYGEVILNPHFAQPSGRGMDLALAKEFLENNNMRIDVRSGAKMLCI